MSLTYNKPHDKSIPIAKMVEFQPFVEMKKYKPSDPLKLIYVDDNYHKPILNSSLELPDDDLNEREEPKHVFEPLPYILPEQRQAIFIWGCSGSGKSVSARKYIEHVRRLKRPYDEPKVYIFSGNDNHDKAFDGMKNLFFVDITKIYLLAQLSYREFQDCIVLFDDWESANPDAAFIMQNLMRQLLEFSRKQNVTIISITHQAMQGPRTKHIIKESDTFIIYHRNDWNSCQRFLTNYLNMSPKFCEENIRRMPGRSLVIRKAHPSLIVSDKSIMML